MFSSAQSAQTFQMRLSSWFATVPVECPRQCVCPSPAQADSNWVHFSPHPLQWKWHFCLGRSVQIFEPQLARWGTETCREFWRFFALEHCNCFQCCWKFWGGRGLVSWRLAQCSADCTLSGIFARIQRPGRRLAPWRPCTRTSKYCWSIRCSDQSTLLLIISYIF